MQIELKNTVKRYINRPKKFLNKLKNIANLDKRAVLQKCNIKVIFVIFCQQHLFP